MKKLLFLLMSLILVLNISCTTSYKSSSNKINSDIVKISDPNIIEYNKDVFKGKERVQIVIKNERPNEFYTFRKLRMMPITNTSIVKYDQIMDGFKKKAPKNCDIMFLFLYK